MAWENKQLYHLYIYMLKRCYSSTTPNYHRYGGRGISVCERWRPSKIRGEGFRNFMKDMGPRPQGYSLERINNDGNYDSENCKWVPRSEQYRNRCTNIKITFQGETLIAIDWARRLGYNRSDVITKRIRNGVSLETALTVKRMPYNSTDKMVEAAAQKKRAQTHCKRGHLLPEKNKNGARVCNYCKTIKMAEYRLAKKTPTKK